MTNEELIEYARRLDYPESWEDTVLALAARLEQADARIAAALEDIEGHVAELSNPDVADLKAKLGAFDLPALT